MRSAGIPEAEARLMLTQAFMADVVDSISYDLIRDRLRQLVERRLSGEKAELRGMRRQKTHVTAEHIPRRVDQSRLSHFRAQDQQQTDCLPSTMQPQPRHRKV